ncbi:MAG: hypothetical protein LUF02_08960 [Erysipelotrichaceae bacterium]|nr:hypothetical protein [Erysipelotrichaceae bacterium]
MSESRIQIKLSDDCYNLFQQIYSKRKEVNPEYTKKQLMEEMIKKEFAEEFQFDSKDKVNNNHDLMTKKIYEYVTLLVKGNQELPKDKESIVRYVNSTSRFDLYINEKIKKEGTSNE